VLTPPFYARLSNQALPPPGQQRQPKPKSSVRAHEPMTRAAKKIMAAQFAKLQALEDDVRTSSNIDAVHDMRVATRRLRSALRLFGRFFSRKTVNKIRAPLGKLTGALGEVRDLDVLIEGLRAYAATLTVEQQRALDPLLADWQARRAQSHHRLVEFLDSTDYDDWVARTEDFIESRDAGDSPRVSEVVPALIWRRYGNVREHETRVKQPTMLMLHALLSATGGNQAEGQQAREHQSLHHRILCSRCS